MKLNKKSNKGFTIIEVMIVLVIAASIMAFILLAVPALNRNSKNNRFRQEAARIMAAGTEWSSNNDGKIPASGTVNASTSATAGSEADAILKNAGTKDITLLSVAKAATPAAVTPTFSTATLQYGVKCPATVSGAVTPTTTGASGRSSVLIYAIEDSTGAAISQCLEG